MKPSIARALLTASLAGAALPAAAQDVAEFYAGKQLKLIVRATPGGNYDIYSRLLGRYMVNHLPGNPSAIPVHMPGGGGIKALNYVAQVAPRDGTVLTIVTQSFPMDQALKLNKNLDVDLRELNWIGNMSDSNQVLVTSLASPTKTLEDAKRRETVIGATGIGSTSAQLTAFYNNMLGTKFKIIYGYPSSPEINLAMERGEAEGRGTSGPQIYLPAGGPPQANFLIQTGIRKLDVLPNVPLLTDLATNDEDRAVFDFISKASSIARPVTAASGVPPERVAALRKAFADTFGDPAFVKEGEGQGLEIGLTRGEDLQRFITDMINAPRSVLDKVAQGIQVKSAQAIPGAKAGGGD